MTGRRLGRCLTHERWPTCTRPVRNQEGWGSEGLLESSVEGVGLTPEQLLANGFIFKLPRAERLIVDEYAVSLGLGIFQPAPDALLSEGGVHQTVVIRHRLTVEE